MVKLNNFLGFLKLETGAKIIGFLGTLLACYEMYNLLFLYDNANQRPQAETETNDTDADVVNATLIGSGQQLCSSIAVGENNLVFRLVYHTLYGPEPSFMSWCSSVYFTALVILFSAGYSFFGIFAHIFLINGISSSNPKQMVAAIFYYIAALVMTGFVFISALFSASGSGFFVLFISLAASLGINYYIYLVVDSTRFRVILSSVLGAEKEVEEQLA